MPAREREKRAFEYRGGVRIAGTIVACDAATGGDLIFLSRALGLGEPTRASLPRAGVARRHILATETTLALLGAAGERLRAHALVAGFGRPFALGNLRLELFPSGRLPGAASLRCAWDGRAVVYAGVIGPGADVRPADALCIDARFGARDVSFSEPAAALAEVVAAARAARLEGIAPVVLVDPSLLGNAPEIARAIAAGGFVVRGPRAVLAVSDAYAAANLHPAPLRAFTGRLAHGEALLWPAGARGPTLRGLARSPCRILVSPFGRQVAALERFHARHGVAMSIDPGFGALVDYVESTGAAEVAVTGAPGGDLVDALRARGRRAYRLGPPRQIELFAAG